MRIVNKLYREENYPKLRKAKYLWRKPNPHHNPHDPHSSKWLYGYLPPYRPKLKGGKLSKKQRKALNEVLTHDYFNSWHLKELSGLIPSLNKDIEAIEQSEESDEVFGKHPRLDSARQKIQDAVVEGTVSVAEILDINMYFMDVLLLSAMLREELAANVPLKIAFGFIPNLPDRIVTDEDRLRVVNEIARALEDRETTIEDVVMAADHHDSLKDEWSWDD